MADKVIPMEMIPDVGSETVSLAGKDYLVANDSMFTFYKRSMGELSPFFLALRDERKILANRCPECGIVRVPCFMTRCPDCNFAALETKEVGDVGEMLWTPPITYFANSLFQKQVPFGRGRFVPEGADTALSVNFYTTKGILVPGMVVKGTRMKVVWREKREGAISDFFCLPSSELRPEQIAKKGLLETDVDWSAVSEPELPVRGAEDTEKLKNAIMELKRVADEMNLSPRARKDIANWYRTISVKTTGGSFSIILRNGDVQIREDASTSPDFIMVCADPAILVNGITYRGSLTQAIMTRKLWISKNVEFTTIFKLERMARSLARSKKS